MLRDRETRRVLVVASGIFLTLGLIVAIGPALPEFARNNGVSMGDVGLVFTILFLGAVPAQLVSGWLDERFGQRLVIGMSLLMLALGLFGATLSHYMPLTLGCMAFAGLGDGVLIVAGNVIVAQSFTRRRASALNLLNVFYGVGAIAGPALAGVFLGLWGTAMPALWFLSALAAMLVLLVPGLPTRAATDIAEEASVTRASIYRSPVLWILSALLLLYVGVEVGTGGWIATYMQRTTGFRPEEAALTASIFYMSLTAGRLLAAALAARLKSSTVLLLSLLLAVAGGIVMAIGVGNGAITFVSFVLLGASFRPIYPTTISIVPVLFHSNAGKAFSLAITVGSIGGIVLPWLQGKLLESVGVGTLSVTVVAAATGMLLAFWAIGLMTRRSSISAIAGVRSVGGQQAVDQA